MLILFGTRRMNKEMGVDNRQLYKCPHCNNVSHYKIVRNRLYFTLFFVPVLPLSSTYYEVCPICERGGIITKAIAKEAVEAPEAIAVNQ